MCLPDALKPADVQQIIATAEEASPRLISLVREIVSQADQTRVASDGDNV
jgi:purine-nucleoside phosphorylase